MPESFESKIQRVGFLVVKDDLGGITVKPANGKIISGLILVVLGVILIPLAIDPINLLLYSSDGLSLDFRMIVNLIKLGISTFGIVLLYRGATRLFEYVGFKLTVHAKEVRIKHRKDIKTELFTISHPQTFECSLDDNNYVIISCTHKHGTTELIKEKNDIVDCFPALKQLTDVLRTAIA